MNATVLSLFQPKHLEKWTTPDSYFGATHFDSYIFLGQNRDSDLLQQSNFEVGLERLGGENFKFDCFNLKEAENLFTTIRANMQGIPLKGAK